MYPKPPRKLPGSPFKDSLKTLGVDPTNVDRIYDLYRIAFSKDVTADTTFAKFDAAIESLRQAIAAQLRNLAVGTMYPYKPGHPNAVQAAHAAQAPDTGHEASTGNFMDVVGSTLSQFFAPSGNQIFVLQFPGRFLQQSLYAWDTSTAGVYGQFIKPPAVNESEFRLTDQLYNIGKTVGGPNATNLSIIYEQVLNNLVPAYHDKDLLERQNDIRKWLLREVKVTPWITELINNQHPSSWQPKVPAPAKPPPPSNASSAVRPGFAVSNKVKGDGDEDGKINRLELSQALMHEYLVSKQAWETERDAKMKEALSFQVGTAESSSALDALNRELAHMTATREAQLAAKYADAVVRGFSHTIREYVGYLDVKSAAEFLQDAKDSFREAASSSFDGALKIYPVQMTPIDWFEGLSTSFTMEDLTSDPELIRMEIDAKGKQLDVLNSQLALLIGSKKGDTAALEAQVNTAQSSLDDATSALALQYSSNVISMAKTCIDAYGNLKPGELETTAGKLKIAGAALDDLKKGMTLVADAQKNLTKASRAFSQLLAAKALAEATDTQVQQKQIQLQITSLNKSIEELTARYCQMSAPEEDTAASTPGSTATATTTTPSPAPSIRDIPKFPKSSTSGGGRWQEISMFHEFTHEESSAVSSTSASSKQSGGNYWIASHSSSSSASAAMFKSHTASKSYKVEFGLRCTLVTVDRGGWFQPQFFKESENFYHVNSKVSWSKWPATIKKVEDLKANQDALLGLNDYLLPAFPVGYIICKVCFVLLDKNKFRL